MSAKNVKAPSLPIAPADYDQEFMNKFLGILRLYFTQLDNIGPIAASTQVNGSNVISGLSFIRPSPTVPGQFVASLPTEADLANLMAGDIYYDTTASNVLKIKT